MAGEIQSVHPVLMCSNVAASAAFYESLGFSLAFQDRPVDPRYAGVVRDGVELHLQWQDARQWAHAIDRPTYRFWVRDVDELYAELRDRGALPEATGRSPYHAPAATPWGTREFHLADPDGNGLHFYRHL